MSEYTNGYAVDTIENEGLEYAVRHYTHGPFKDPDTQRLWMAANDAMQALVDHLEAETGREID